MWELLKDTVTQWSEDKPAQLSAALAYYTIFSLAPLLIITIAIAGLVFGQQATENQLVGALEGLVGREGAQAIQAMIQSASVPQSGVLATLVGLVTLLLGAVGVVGQLQDSLNTIWQVAPKPGRGMLGMLRDRIVSFAMILGIGFLLLVSLAVSAALAALSQYLRDALPGGTAVWQAVDVFVSFGFITLLFAMIYKVLPDVSIAWRDVWIGAAMTSVLFTLGKFLIGLYLGHSGVGSPYGAAGSLVVILVWVYYSAQIFFFGAEFTQVYANRYGSGVVPAENAIPLSEANTQLKRSRPVNGRAAPPGSAQ